MRELVRVFKALGDETRIRILKLLQKKDFCVCELTEILGLAQSSISSQLKILKDAGLVDDKRNGPWIDYCLSRERVNPHAPVLLKLLSSWIEKDSRVKEDRQKAKGVHREEVCKR